MKWNLQRLNARFGPWVSLAFGLAAALFFRRGLWFAPWAVGILLAAWVLAAFLGRLVEREQLLRSTENEPSRVRRLVRTAARSAVASMYQNVLFFLLPLWFISATWSSGNILFPLLLAAMAVLSCFDVHYEHWVVTRTWLRTVWNAVILFAALVAAVPALTSAPLGWTVAGAAGLSALAAAWLRLGAKRDRPARAAALLALVVLGAGGAAYLLAPLLPPVPVQCVEAGVGTGVEQRELTGRADEFAAGSERVYAWFAVAAPERFRHRVTFLWRCNGQQVGRPYSTEAVGGRKEGFRTWAFVSRPGPGFWQADLLSDGGQLIGRVAFDVGVP